MEAAIKYKLDRFEAEETYFGDNEDVFPPDSPGGRAAARHREIVAAIRQTAAEQLSGSGLAMQASADKLDAYDTMWDIIRDMNFAAYIMKDDIPNITERFSIPDNRSQQNVAAQARANLIDGAPLADQFKDAGMRADFMTVLQDAVDRFDAHGATADTQGERRSGATGGLFDLARQGMQNSRKMDAFVRLKFKGNVQKLAAWKTAHHLDKAPQRQKDEEPETEE